jgi:class 3 adenylate cyclase
MREAIYELNGERSVDGLPSIKTGIGMHTGSLIMGITGDEYRMDAATISDTVNTAASN